MPTIRDVAKACGVSPMTVSFVINNKPGQVGTETRERVLRTIRELNYRPAAAKNPDVDREICTLGIVAGVPGSSLTEAGYFGSIINGVLGGADEMGHNVTILNHSLLHTDTRRALRAYCDGRCDGLIVVAPPIGSKLVPALHERGLPFVLIGDSGDDATFSCVDIDNHAVAVSLTEHLLKLGHRRIAFLGGPDFVRSAVLRLRAYRQTLAAHGLPVSESDILDNVHNHWAIEEWITEKMRQPHGERPTALFGWNDGIAGQALSALQKLGVKIPQELSVVGIDDLSAEDLNPPLSAMRQPYREIGRTAVEILTSLIRGEVRSAKRVFMSTEFIDRGSTAPSSPGPFSHTAGEGETWAPARDAGNCTFALSDNQGEEELTSPCPLLRKEGKT